MAAILRPPPVTVAASGGVPDSMPGDVPGAVAPGGC